MAPPKKAAAVDNTSHLETALHEIALAGSYPNADLEGLAHLQAMVTQMLHKVRGGGEGGQADPGSALAQMQGGGAPGGPPAPGGAPPPGGMPPGMNIAAMLGTGNPQSGGMMPGMSPPNPDELAKILGPALKGGVQ